MPVQAHEYSVIGHNRARIGRYLSIAAGVIAAGCTVIVTALVDVARTYGFGEWIPNILLLPITAAVVYPLAYWLFDTWAWKCAGLRRWLDIPDLSGKWRVTGTTLGNDGEVVHEWRGELSVYQTWDKIKVDLTTGQSASHSIAASVIRDPARGYILMYSYHNEPRIGEPELQQHVGYCELDFNRDVTSADGQYFNNRGRTTFGRMRITRREV